MRKRNSHTSSLFHYTKKFDALLSIIQNGLKFFYCSDFLFMRFYACPMVCFCDIPMTDNEEHSEKYGSYAIGLSKEALISKYRKNLGPVNYVLSNRPVNAAFELKNLAYKETEQYVGRSIDDLQKELTKEMQVKLRHLLSSSKAIGFMKPYETLHKGQKVCCYNECEWRLVIPEFTDLDVFRKSNWFWNANEFFKWVNAQNGSKLFNCQGLLFPSHDIDYIVVPTNKDIPIIREKILSFKMIGGYPSSQNEIETLVNKIYSFEQISNTYK